MVKTLAAITTPFGTHGDVDLDAFEAHVRWLDECGLDGLFVAGTTGEGVLLESDESRRSRSGPSRPRARCA